MTIRPGIYWRKEVGKNGSYDPECYYDGYEFKNETDHISFERQDYNIPPGRGRFEEFD